MLPLISSTILGRVLFLGEVYYSIVFTVNTYNYVQDELITMPPQYTVSHEVFTSCQRIRLYCTTDKLSSTNTDTKFSLAVHTSFSVNHIT